LKATNDLRYQHISDAVVLDKDFAAELNTNLAADTMTLALVK
jgi:hypothetical protein